MFQRTLISEALNEAGRQKYRFGTQHGYVASIGSAHEVNVIACYHQPGPATKYSHALNAQYGGFPGLQRYCFTDNILAGRFVLAKQAEGRTVTTERGGKLPTEYSPWVEKPFFDAYVNTKTASTTYTNVLADVGCDFPALDEHDLHIIAETRAGKFKGNN